MYVSILFSAIVLVLLPFSVVTYLNFYKMLIPTERIQVPTKFEAGEAHWEHIRSTSRLARERSTLVDSLAVLPFVRINQDLTYLIRLNLNAVCNYEKSFQVLEYTFNSSHGVISDEMLVNCDLRYIYVEKNNFIPYNLRYWVPPILVDIFKTVRTDWVIVQLHGLELLDLLTHLNPIFKFANSDPIFINSRQTTMDFVVEWEGIRYYMVNFYVTSFILGVGGFWVLSAWICLISSVISLRYFTSPDDSKTYIKKEI